MLCSMSVLGGEIWNWITAIFAFSGNPCSGDSAGMPHGGAVRPRFRKSTRGSRKRREQQRHRHSPTLGTPRRRNKKKRRRKPKRWPLPRWIEKRRNTEEPRHFNLWGKYTSLTILQVLMCKY